ncbi:hypothetical protein C5613_09665 [Rhodococcus opacus]|uniref:Uncharacterized protein n=1 Tax=Rhodococcus opacus TaxID=37919 RepID=A0A2S8JDN2_RHOOP|nr:hypothetical protein C5613_09665 [Rhodococcus opacus]
MRVRLCRSGFSRLPRANAAAIRTGLRRGEDSESIEQRIRCAEAAGLPLTSGSGRHRPKPFTWSARTWPQQAESGVIGGPSYV